MMCSDALIRLFCMKTRFHTEGNGDYKCPLDVPLEYGGVGVPVEVLHDPAVHGGHGLHAIGAGDLAYLAENKVVHPAQLGRDDLRRLPRRRCCWTKTAI